MAAYGRLLSVVGPVFPAIDWPVFGLKQTLANISRIFVSADQISGPDKGSTMNKYVLLLLIAFATLQPAFADSFVVGTVEAQRGHQASGYLSVPPGIDDGTTIPITVAHGTGNGPTLALIAGTHGYEYPGITALQRLRKSLDPSELSGVAAARIRRFVCSRHS